MSGTLRQHGWDIAYKALMMQQTRIRDLEKEEWCSLIWIPIYLRPGPVTAIEMPSGELLRPSGDADLAGVAIHPRCSSSLPIGEADMLPIPISGSGFVIFTTAAENLDAYVCTSIYW
jgi:hypothetical protein